MPIADGEDAGMVMWYGWLLGLQWIASHGRWTTKTTARSFSLLTESLS